MLIPSSDDDFVGLDRDIPMICERAFGQCFAAYRLIATIQTKSASDEAVYEVSINHDITLMMELLGNFKSIHHAWTHVCIDRFLQLSTRSQLSFGKQATASLYQANTCPTGFLIIFWNLAVLRLFDVIRYIRSTTVVDSSDLDLVTEYRRDSVSAFATISKLIMSISEDDDLPVLDQAGVRLAFVAHHANSALMSFALETAIRHTIELLADQPREDEANRRRALKPLVWCLLSMERTNAGRTVSRPSFHRLMEQYGDTILEFWTPEDDNFAFTASFSGG